MKTKTSERTELSRLAIVDRALTIADAEGIDAVTVRRLAQEFGVTPMALYWHVRNKDELLAAMGDRFFDDFPPVAEGGEWPAELRALLAALVQCLRRHPGAAHLAGARALQCDAGRDLAERTLRLLRGAGFSIAQAADLTGRVMQTAMTLVLGQAGAEPGIPDEERAAVRHAKREYLEALPKARFPLLVESADAFCSCDDEVRYFDFGIDLFVAGAEQVLQRSTAQSSA